VPPFPLAVWAPHLPFWSRPDRPTLLIVDYAEQRPAEELRALARAVGEAAPERRAPLALLLLMRADPREPAAGHVADALAEARIRWEARRVPPVEDPEDRQALFRKARARFREALAPPDAPPEVDYEPEDLPRTPLALLALAVLAAHGHRVVQSQDEAAILTDLWEQWEQPRWRRTLEAQGGRELLQTPEVWAEARERIEQALAAASLGRPFTAPEEVAAWWEAYFPFRKRTARGERLDPSWLAERLKVLFPGVGEAWRLPPISPDPLADVALARFGADLGHLVESILPAPEEIEKASLAIRRLVEGWERGEAPSPEQLGGLMIWIWPVHMVREVLPRLSAAAVPGASEAARAALEAATRWLEKTVEVLPEEVAAAWLGTWGRSLPPPDRTVLLRPFEEVAYRSWVKRAIDEAERARALGMWGFALSALGRRAEALQATQEAVDLYRRLAAQHPDAFLPYLAASLNNLGAVLSEMGRRAEALQATQEAVETTAGLAAQHPDAFLPDLARSLTNLGIGCFPKWAGGRRPCKPRRRRWTSTAAWPPNTPTPSSPTWRGASTTWAPCFPKWAGGRRPCKPRRRRWTSTAAWPPNTPTPSSPTWPRSLHNLGNRLSEMGRRAEALQATQEAVELYRRLAAQHPDAFLPDLARQPQQPGQGAFRNGPAGGGPASHAGGGGRSTAAWPPNTPTPSSPTWRGASTTWASGFPKWAGGRRPCKPRRRRWTSTAAWPPNTPTPSSPYLAGSLNNLGNPCFPKWAGGRRPCKPRRRRWTSTAAWPAQNPDAFLPYLAASLNNLGAVLSELGRREEALQATQEAVDLRRRLAAQHPDAFLPDLASSLGAYGLVLRGLGRSAEAAAAFAEGLRAILPFVRALPAAFGGLAGALLQDYLRACAEAGEAPDEALVAQARRAIG
jgi:tetratricopeptide (TPR) repeat protein